MKPVIHLPYKTPMTYLPNGMDCELSEIDYYHKDPVIVFFPETSCYLNVRWEDVELRDNAEEKAREAFLRGCKARAERGAAELSEGPGIPIDQAIYEAKEREEDKIPYKDGMEIISEPIKDHPESWTIATDGTDMVKDIWPTETLTDETVKERGKIYGDPELSHENIGLQWTGVIQQHFGIRLPHALPAWLVELMMGAFKINRSARVYHEDNYVDFEAYVLKFASEHQKAPTPGFVREGGAE